jgi:hypothetical protein
MYILTLYPPTNSSKIFIIRFFAILINIQKEEGVSI